VTVDLVIRGGRVHDVPADIVVDRGSIVSVARAGEGGLARRVIEAHGLTVLPGAVDAHVHFDAPGRDEWEGWSSGSLAAAAGGVTTVVDMPIDSDPPTIDPDAVREKRTVAEGQSLVDFGLWGGLVPDNAMSLAPLLGSGVIGLKAFMCDSGWEAFPACDADVLSSGMRAAAAARLPVAVHCEDASLFGPEDGHRPVTSEVAAVATAGALAATHGTRLHVVHCSSADAVLEAKLWPQVSVETCPHYLALCDQDVARIGTDALCCPPIRDEDQRKRLLRCVVDGLVDTVASDHSPCPPEAKAGAAPFAGVSGVETTLSVLLSLSDLKLERINQLRTAAARLLGLSRKGSLAPGFEADLVLVDDSATWTVSADSLHTRHRRSPFAGAALPGVVVATLVRGSVVFEAGRRAAEPDGRFVTPAGSLAVVSGTGGSEA
jgi:allantoinase